MSGSTEITMADIDRIVAEIPGDISVYQVRGTVYRTLYYSPSTPAVQGMTDEEYREMLRENASDSMLESDRMRLYLAVKECIEEHHEMGCSYRLIHKTKGIVWVHARAKELGVMDGYPVILVNFSNTSAEASFYSSVLDYTPSMVFLCERNTYEILYANEAACDFYGINRDEVYGVPCYKALHGRETPCDRCTIPTGDDIEMPTTEQYDEDNERWLRISGSMISWSGYDAYVRFLEDITAHKHKVERFRGVLQTMLSANPEALCTFQLNLTQNICSEEHGTSEFVSNLLSSDSVDGLFESIAGIIGYPEERTRFLKMFDRHNLLRRFAKGESHISMEYRRLVEEDDVHWVTTYLTMVENPMTADIEAVAYSVDSNDRKRREEAT